MTERTKLLRLKKSISFILQPKPDSQASKIHLDTIGGLVLFSFKKSCQTTILLSVALESIIN